MLWALLRFYLVVSYCIASLPAMQLLSRPCKQQHI